MKKAAFIIIAVPLGFLSLFLFGETFSGGWEGFSHLLQIIPIILVLLLAWKKPFWGGLLFILSSLVLGVAYAIDARDEPITIFIVELLLFVPLLLSGYLLIKDNKQTKKKLK